MAKKVKSNKWKGQFRYAYGFTKRCARDYNRVKGFEKTILDANKDIAKKMTKVKDLFEPRGAMDLNNWDCDAMYPRPKPVSQDKGLGGKSKAAKVAFAVYNKVKNFIPGGSFAGAGAVPGSTSSFAEELLELPEDEDAEPRNIEWGAIVETISGAGAKIKDALG